MISATFGRASLWLALLLLTAVSADSHLDEICTCVAPPVINGGLCGCYGDVSSIDLPSAFDAKLAAYKTAVDEDAAKLEAFRNCFEQMAVKFCVEPSILAAWASRENNFDGANINGYGIFGCDADVMPECKTFAGDSCDYVEFMLKYFLATFFDNVQFCHVLWLPEMKLQGSLAAYDGGLGAIVELVDFANVDASTVNQDYSSDIVIRAQRLISNHGWQCFSQSDAFVVGYDCVTNIPCTAANRALEKYHFAYSGSRGKFVQCSEWEQCFIMPCRIGLVFNPAVEVCDWP